MVKACYQVRPNGMLIPQSELDSDTVLDSYSANKLVNVVISGGDSARSIPENALFHLCCKKTAENCKDPTWGTVKSVKIQCKMALKFFKEDADGKIGLWCDDGSVYFELDTLEFTKTTQTRSHKFIIEAIDLMAQKLGCTVEQLTNNAGHNT